MDTVRHHRVESLLESFEGPREIGKWLASPRCVDGEEQRLQLEPVQRAKKLRRTLGIAQVQHHKPVFPLCEAAINPMASVRVDAEPLAAALKASGSIGQSHIH